MAHATIAMTLGCGCLLHEAVSRSLFGSTHGERQGLGRVEVRPCRTPSLPELITSISFARSEVSYSPLYLRQKTPSHVCFAGGKRPRKPRVWKTKVRRGSFAKGNKLVEMVLSLSDVKEEVYSALDSWVAWELEFPLVAVKKALKTLHEMKEYKKIIQVSKWMLSKGQGKTMGTYELLIEAFSKEERVEEAEALWQKIFAQHLECVPRIMFGRIFHMYEAHGLDEKAIELFFDMEDLGVKPDRRSVELVASIYGKKGDHEKEEQILQKYPRPTFEWRRYRGKWIRVPVKTSADEDQTNEINTEYQLGDETNGRDLLSTDAGFEEDAGSEEEDSDEEVMGHEQQKNAEIMSDAQRSHGGNDDNWSGRRNQKAMHSPVGDNRMAELPVIV